jgi:hypothetical protein
MILSNQKQCIGDSNCTFPNVRKDHPATMIGHILIIGIMAFKISKKINSHRKDMQKTNLPLFLEVAIIILRTESVNLVQCKQCC